MFTLLFRHTAVVTLTHRSAAQRKTKLVPDATARKMKLLPDATKNPCRGEPSSPSPGSQAPRPEGVPSSLTPEGVPSLGVPWVEFQWRPTYHLRAQTPWPGVIPDGPSPGPNPNRSRPLKLRMRILVVAYRSPFQFPDGESRWGLQMLYARARSLVPGTDGLRLLRDL